MIDSNVRYSSDIKRFAGSTNICWRIWTATCGWNKMTDWRRRRFCGQMSNVKCLNADLADTDFSHPFSLFHLSLPCFLALNLRLDTIKLKVSYIWDPQLHLRSSATFDILILAQQLSYRYLSKRTKINKFQNFPFVLFMASSVFCMFQSLGGFAASSQNSEPNVLLNSIFPRLHRSISLNESLVLLTGDHFLETYSISKR